MCGTLRNAIVVVGVLYRSRVDSKLPTMRLKRLKVDKKGSKRGRLEENERKYGGQPG